MSINFDRMVILYGNIYSPGLLHWLPWLERRVGHSLERRLAAEPKHHVRQASPKKTAMPQ